MPALPLHLLLALLLSLLHQHGHLTLAVPLEEKRNVEALSSKVDNTASVATLIKPVLGDENSSSTNRSDLNRNSTRSDAKSQNSLNLVTTTAVACETATEQQPVVISTTTETAEADSTPGSPQDVKTPPENQTIKIRDSSHWEVISSFNLSSTIPVSKFRSRLTGLTVVLAKSDSPIVNGYLCLATEAHDNDGLPHTLEHLVFLGSEDYPYKEVLDLLANRCLADRTNAWTDTDHTCYTVYTAGSSGFLHILPVYLDHILYPLLREQDYLTEVHHINGEGQDAGVVYSEMQGVEHKSSNIMYFALARILYPGNSGYYAETGGYLQNIRNSTNIQKVRAYHRKYYRPENLVITITGKVEEEQLFRVMRKIEEKVLRKRAVDPVEPYQRPWQGELAKISPDQPKEISVEYPSDDETIGNVAVAWRLPEKISDSVETIQAYELLMKYVSTTQVSPLEAEFVEIADPLATSVSADILEVREPSILIEFENVPTNRIDEIVPKMEEVFQKIVDDGPEAFDLERINNFIDREIINNLKDTENSPHLFVPDAVVLDMLYGEEPAHLEQFVRSSQLNKQFRDKTAEFWLEIIKRVFIDTPKYVVKGIPSRTKLEADTSAEEERISRQVAELGEQGLKEKGELVRQAIKSQKLPGIQVLEKIPLGDVESIQFREFRSVNRTLNANCSVDFSEIPYRIHIDDVASQFVQMYLFLNTSVLDKRQKKFLPLLLDFWLVSPIKKGEQLIPIEEVVKRRSKTILHIDNSLGFDGATFTPGANGDAIVIEVQAELAKFKKAIIYLNDALLYPHFLEQKVNSTAANLLNKIAPLKQSAEDVLRTLFDGIFFNEESNIHHTSFLRQKVFLEGLLNDLEDNPEKVLKELTEIVDRLARTENAFLYLGTSLDALTASYGKSLPVLQQLLNRSYQYYPTEIRSLETNHTRGLRETPKASGSFQKRVNRTRSSSCGSSSQGEGLATRYDLPLEYHYRRVNSTLPRHLAFGVGGTESCYFKQSIMYNLTDWYAPETGDARVMLQYLTDRMYDEVRGPGLTYGVSMSLSLTEGRVILSFTRSSRLVDAYRAARNILTRYSRDPTLWDPTLLDSARGSMIYSWAENEETVEDLASQSIKSYMRKTDTSFNRQFVKSLANISVDGIKENARKLLPAFLDGNSTNTVIVCNPPALEDIIQEFKQFDIELTTWDSLEDSFLAQD